MSRAREQQEADPDHQRVPRWLRIQEVLHPYDPREENGPAFVHALRFASFARARLSLMCLPAGDMSGAMAYPPVRETLEQWKVDAASEPQRDSQFQVQYLQAAGQDPVDACVKFVKTNPTDLIVLSTSLHEGRMTWIGRSMAEALAGRAGEMTLFVPPHIGGFVSRDDGSVALTSILIPVAQQPRPEPAIEAVRRVILSLPRVRGNVILLHVGPPDEMPEMQLPETPGWTWTRACSEGGIVDTILKTAADTRAGLIVMTTEGRHGFLDALRGTVTEHVLRDAACPMLAMPEGSFLG